MGHLEIARIIRSALALRGESKGIEMPKRNHVAGHTAESAVRRRGIAFARYGTG